MLDLHALQFLFGRPFLNQAREFVIEHLLQLCKVLARACGGDDLELAGNLTRIDEGRNATGDLFFVNEAIVETAGLAGGQERSEKIEVVGILGTKLGNIPNLVKARLRNAV